MTDPDTRERESLRERLSRLRESWTDMDSDALESDWRAVGEDLKRAYWRVERDIFRPRHTEREES